MDLYSLKIEWVRAHPRSGIVSYDHLSWLEDKMSVQALNDRFFAKVLRHQQDVAEGDAPDRDRTCFLARNVAFASNATTDKDCAIFFSGKHKTGAEFFILNNPHYQAIHTLPVGLFLETLNLFGHKDISREEAYDIWNIAGRRYAENASGNVMLVVNGKIDITSDLSTLAQELPDYGTFRSIELPRLLANDRVPTINGRDKWQFRSLVTDDFKIFEYAERQRDAKLAKITRQSKIAQKTLKA